MQTARRRRRTTWAIALSALAHVGLLLTAPLERPTLPPLADEPAGPPEAIIPLLLMPRTPPAAAGATAPTTGVRLHRRGLRPDDDAPPVAPSPAAAAPTVRPAEPAPSGPASALPPAGSSEGPPGPDLRLALRHGVAGCANLSATGMSRTDRERCEDQLGKGSTSAPFMPAALEPRLRGYYDAVAVAKSREPQPVPVVNKAPIKGDPPPRPKGYDHIPLVGCSIPFGVGATPKLPSHWLKVGPCFIASPKGPLSPEADITPP